LGRLRHGGVVAGRLVLSPWARRGLGVGVLLGSVVAALAFYRSSAGSLAATLSHADGRYLTLALPTYLVAMLLAMFGWHQLCRQAGMTGGLLLDATNYGVSTAAGRLPGGIWGLATRTYLYRVGQVRTEVAAAAWVLEQLIVLLAGLGLLVIWLVVASAISFGGGLAVGLVAVIGALAGTGVALKQAPLPRRLASLPPKRFSAGIAWLPSPKRLVGWLAIYAGVWILGGIVLFETLRALGYGTLRELPAIEVAWISSRAVALLVNVLPSGLGLSEASLTLLLLPLVPAPIAAASAIAVRIETTIGEFGVAVVCVILLVIRRGNGRAPSTLSTTVAGPIIGGQVD
jgi:hypothetical protein